MRILVLVVALLIAAPVTAQPLVTIVETVGVQLQRANVNVSVWPTLVACMTEGRRLALADPRTTGSVVYRCQQLLTASYAPAPPPVSTIVLSVPQTTVTCSPSIGPTLPLTAILAGVTPTRVEFLRDGIVMQAVTAPPYQMNWQLYCGWTQGGPIPGRPTVLTARRIDGAAIVTSAPITMFVLDPAPPPPPPQAFSLVARWDPNDPVDQVIDYEMVVNTGPAVIVPPTPNTACDCIQAPAQVVPAGTFTFAVRARNEGGVSPPTTITVTRP